MNPWRALSFSDYIQVLSELKLEKKGGQDTEGISRTEPKEKSRNSLEKELALYEKMGVSLYLEGKRSNPRTIASACQIADGGGYMRDYTEDEQGHIARVDFDFVEDETKKET